MHSTHSERKSVAAERFMTTLKNKICKYITLISKNVYINKLDEMVNKYNNTYHKTVKLRPVDVMLLCYVILYGHMLLLILTMKKLFECSLEKNCKKQIKKSLK